MRNTPAQIAAFVVVIALGACKTDHSRFALPTVVGPDVVSAPPPEPPAPPPVVVPRERWIVRTAYAGHTGPEACIAPFDGAPRLPVDGVIEIYHSEGTIHFLTEHNHYVGDDSREAFHAVENGHDSGTWLCAGARIAFEMDGYVLGQFHEGGNALTGEEVATARLASGERITRRWTFSGSLHDVSATTTR